MSAPVKFSPPEGVVYDEALQVCRPADPLESTASIPADATSELTHLSMSRLYHEAFAPAHRPERISTLWSHSPLSLTAWAAMPVACSSDPVDPPSPGDPIDRVESLSPETAMNTSPILGNIDGVGFGSNAGNHSLVAWSAFDGTSPANSGTFGFVRAGETGGSQVTVSDDVSSRHLSTSAAALSDGSSIVIYTRATGPDSPSSIVAKRISASGTVASDEIEVLASSTRATLPAGQVVATENGFVVVYRDDDDHLHARSFSNAGVASGAAVDLGEAPAQYSLAASGTGDHWGLAEIVTPNEVHVRTFDGTGEQESNVIPASHFPSDPDISLAMQPDGGMMVAWNAEDGTDQRIDGAILSPDAELRDGPFLMRRSGLANTLALASDRHGNYIFAWEESGRINGYIFDGTREYFRPADFDNISTGSNNSNIQLSVSPEGIVSLVFDKTTTTSGDVAHQITRRDFRIVYQ